MRAFVFTQYGGPEYQQFIDLEIPTPDHDELLVAVHAAAVNPKDVKVREGLSERLDRIESSVGLGREASGIVTAIGDGVENFAVGDAVLGSVIVGQSAGLSEYALLRAARTVDKPPSVSFVDAGAMSLVFATAYDSIEQLALPPGATLLIIGVGGGVGIAAAQIARPARGINVIGTASSSKHAWVTSHGVTHVVSGDGAAGRVITASPQGVDAIFDLVGGDPLRELAPLVADRSMIITASDAATAEEVGGSKVVRVRSSSVLEACMRLVEQGLLGASVTEVFPFEQTAQAMQVVESGHTTGKIVVQVR